MIQMTSLASQLFLVLHDPFTGKGQVSQELLEYGVAAAQLADLILVHRLWIDDDDQVVLGQQGQGGPTDAVGDYVLGCVADQPRTYPARTWVTSLGTAVTDLVVGELVGAGVVRHEATRGLRGRRQDRFPGVDLLRASHSRNHVRHMLANPGEFDLPGATLASLVHVLGVEQVFELANTQQVFAELSRYNPKPLQSVLAGLAAAVAGASVTMGGRR